MNIKKTSSKFNININQLNKIINPNIKSIQNKRQPTPATNVSLAKLQSKQSNNLLESIKKFIGPSGNVYLTFGGTGDLILVLAECYNDPSAKVLFFANSTAVEFGKKFLDFFKLRSFISPNIMGSRIANDVYNYLQSTGRLKTSAHLAKDLYFGDWALNTENYKQRMVLETNWIDEIGFIPEYKNNKCVVIAPSGSFKSTSRQKFLYVDEFQQIVNYYLKKDYKVFATGSEKDYSYYPKISHKNYSWLCADKLIINGKPQPINSFVDFLKIINSASLIISVDTWLKTYTSLAKILTKVILNRNKNEWLPLGSDPCDFIFLNENFWPSMQLIKTEDVFLKNGFTVE